MPGPSRLLSIPCLQGHRAAAGARTVSIRPTKALLLSKLECHNRQAQRTTLRVSLLFRVEIFPALLSRAKLYLGVSQDDEFITHVLVITVIRQSSAVTALRWCPRREKIICDNCGKDRKWFSGEKAHCRTATTAKLRWYSTLSCSFGRHSADPFGRVACRGRGLPQRSEGFRCLQKVSASPVCAHYPAFQRASICGTITGRPALVTGSLAARASYSVEGEAKSSLSHASGR